MNNLNNPLVQRYQQNQKSNIPFQNNNLLLKNPMFRNNMNYNNSEQMQQMQMMNQMRMAQLNKLKEMQQIKQIERYNEIESSYDKDKIRESVIQPLKIDKSNNTSDLIKTIKDRWGEDITTQKTYGNKHTNIANQFEKMYATQKDKLHKSRTNMPYKHIITEKKHYEQFLKNPNRKLKDAELMVHKVTNKDKEGVDDAHDELVKNIEVHDGELKVIYSTSKAVEHKKEFEYSHKSQFRIKYDPSDHTDLKKTKINVLKKEQKKMEKNKKTKDQLIHHIVNEGIFDEEELKQITENIKEDDSEYDDDGEDDDDNDNKDDFSLASVLEEALELNNPKYETSTKISIKPSNKINIRPSTNAKEEDKYNGISVKKIVLRPSSNNNTISTESKKTEDPDTTTTTTTTRRSSHQDNLNDSSYDYTSASTTTSNSNPNKLSIRSSSNKVTRVSLNSTRPPRQTPSSINERQSSTREEIQEQPALRQTRQVRQTQEPQKGRDSQQIQLKQGPGNRRSTTTTQPIASTRRAGGTFIVPSKPKKVVDTPTSTPKPKQVITFGRSGNVDSNKRR